MYPLHAAAFAGHTTVVQVLLANGADPRLKGGFDSTCQAAFLGQHEDLVIYLLENHFELYSQAEYDQMVQQGAEAGFTRVIDHLTSRYQSFGSTMSGRNRAVELAILNGRHAVVERFLHKMPMSQEHIPSSAVAMAALGGHNATVTLLLDKGQDIEREGSFGSPLRAASLMGHESTVRLLLTCGARMDSCGKLGTALYASSLKGHISISRLLIHEGADVGISGGFHGNALQAAAYQGHYMVAELLLDAGASINQRGRWENAIHAAAAGGQDAILCLCKDRCYIPPYSWADDCYAFALLGTGDEYLYRDMLEEHSPTRRKSEQPSSTNKTFSDDSCIPPSATFDQALAKLQMSADFDGCLGFPTLYRKLADSPHEHALIFAASRGFDDVVESFVRREDHHLWLKQSTKGNILKAAAGNGQVKIVDILIYSKFDLMSYLETAIEAAVDYGHTTIVDNLLEYRRRKRPSDEEKLSTATVGPPFPTNNLFPVCLAVTG